MKLDAILPSVLGALFFMASAIVLGVLEISKIHSLWLIPSGFVFAMISVFIFSSRIPVLNSALKILGSVYAGIVRIGISQEKIRAAQESDNMETIQNWLDKKKMNRKSQQGSD